MKNVLAAVALAGAMAGALDAQSPAGSPRPADAELRAIIVDRIDTQRQSVGIVIGVVDSAGRQVVAHGHRAAGDVRAVDRDTVFEIGSVTKVFTALLLSDTARRHEVTVCWDWRWRDTPAPITSRSCAPASAGRLA